MKRILLMLLFACSWTSAASGEEAFPGSVRHTVLKDGSHEYVVAGISNHGRLTEETSGLLSELLPRVVPNCTTASLSLATFELRFVTTAPLTNLPAVLNDMARYGAGIPYWDELIARDRKSSSFTSNLYSLVSVVTNTPYKDEKDPRRTWLHISRHTPSVSVGLRYAKDRTGTLRFNRATSHCMAHDRFAMRIEDEKGQWIWEDTDSVYASSDVTIADLDGDGVDEIIVFREDHEINVHTLTWKRNTQPAAALDRNP